MTALSMPIIPSDTYTELELDCEEDARLTAAMREHYNAIELLAEERSAPRRRILNAIRPMLANGQKSKKVGRFTITAGIITERFCAGEGALLESCKCKDKIDVIERTTGEPWVSVKAVSEGDERG